MKTLRLPFALALLTPFAWAQDGDHATPNANDPAYAPLKAFVGTWDLSIKTTMEGQPASEVTGTETFESVCNGLFVKSVVNSTFMGQPFQGISLWGYDQKAKNYVNIWTDSMNQAAVKSTGTYDAAKKTWTSKTVAGHGPSRSTIVWKDDNTSIDTSYTAGADGKEAVAMEITRKRAKPATQKPTTTTASTPLTEVKAQAEKAVASAPAALSAGHKELQRVVGKWNVTMKMPSPDGSVQESPGHENNSAVCNGLWVWSDFQATFMGQPFEGHCLAGYDAATKTYTNYWIDTMSPAITVLTGTHDDKTKTISLSGTTVGPDGADSAMAESITWKSEHNREANFTFGSGAEAQKMTIEYTRAQQTGAHKIK